MANPLAQASPGRQAVHCCYKLEKNTFAKNNFEMCPSMQELFGILRISIKEKFCLSKSSLIIAVLPFSEVIYRRAHSFDLARTALT